MSLICQLVEYSRAPVVGGVIKGVKVVGNKSIKGVFYPQAVLAQAIPLYEGSPVHICHGDAREMKQRRRTHQSHFGHLANVHEQPGKTGLYADLHIKQSHCLAGMIAESDGREFGLSHQVQAETNVKKTEVLKILEVDSVDLVDNPATTQNLFEGIEDMDLAEMEATQKAQAAEIKTITEGQGKIMTLLEGLQPAKAKPAPEPKGSRITALEDVVDPEKETLPTFGHSRDAFAAGLRGVSGGTV